MTKKNEKTRTTSSATTFPVVKLDAAKPDDTVASAPTVTTLVPPPPLTNSDLIWNEIKSKPMAMFGLPPKTVDSFVKRVEIEPSKVYVTLSVGSVLPMLEEVLGSQFAVELNERFVTIARKA